MTVRNIALEHFSQDHNGDVIRTGVEWKDMDQFFIYGQYLYYYKPQLEELFAAEALPQTQDGVDAYNRIVAFTGPSTTVMRSLDFVRTLLRSRGLVTGLPPYVRSTNHFYKFENICTTKVEATDITPQLLQRIKETFSSSYNPLLSTTLFDSLYEHNGNLYCTDLRKFLINPAAKLGVFHDNGSTLVFYPFQQLTPEQEAFVQDFGIVDSNYGTPVTITYL